MEKHISNLQELGVRSLPANFGPLRNANANARIKGPCGDTMEIWLRIEGEYIKQATYITDGCHSSHACGAMTAWLAESKSLNEALQLTPEEVFKAAGEQVEEHCSLLAVNTLRATLKNYRQQQKIAIKQIQHLNQSSKFHSILKILKMKIHESSNTSIE